MVERAVVGAFTQQLGHETRARESGRGKPARVQSEDRALVIARAFKRGRFGAERIEYRMTRARHAQRRSPGRRQAHRDPSRVELAAALPRGTAETAVAVLGALQERDRVGDSAARG